MRGAYEVGVVAGIMEVLDPEPGSGSCVSVIFAGTSVGAINATYLASNAVAPRPRRGALGGGVGELAPRRPRSLSSVWFGSLARGIGSLSR